jgi:hypothetical protein
MNEVDQEHLEAVFNLPPNDTYEQDAIQHLIPVDPLSLTADDVRGILKSYGE